VSGGPASSHLPFLPLSPLSISCSSRNTPVDLGLGFFRNSSPILFVPNLNSSLHDLLLTHLDQQPRPALIPLIAVSKILGANPVGEFLVT
jgi:hypothetical protein